MTKQLLVILVVFASSANGFASSLTIREMKLNAKNQLEITLDGAPAKNSLELEYVRDIVQFSIQNATIYPAKILHAENGSAFNKVFAYQYAPSLVRVRFSVEGKADAYQGKVKWDLKGKTLTVAFPVQMTAVKKEENSEHEKSLIAKVLGESNVKPALAKIEAKPVTEKTIERNSDRVGEKGAAQSLDKENLAQAESNQARADAQAEKFEAKDERSEAKLGNHTHRLTGNGNSNTGETLGGAKAGPSPLRSFFAMFLVVGGLGLVLIYVKKKKNTVQAKKVGDSWLSHLLPNAKKQKSLIEVVGVHALGPKQSITIVRIRGQQLVLGVTEGNVQLITQLDSDEEIDVLDDPKVADSLGRIFGAKPQVERAPEVQAPARGTNAPRAAQPQPGTRAAPATRSVSNPDLGASFNAMLKSSTGAGAIVARNAYQSQGNAETGLQSNVRDQIKQRLQGMRS